MPMMSRLILHVPCNWTSSASSQSKWVDINRRDQEDKAQGVKWSGEYFGQVSGSIIVLFLGSQLTWISGLAQVSGFPGSCISHPIKILTGNGIQADLFHPAPEEVLSIHRHTLDKSNR